MSPLGIKRFVAFLLVLSPWIFIPGLFKDIIFIIAGILLFISTLDLRRKTTRSADHQETESMPRAASGEAYSRSGGVHSRDEEVHSQKNDISSSGASISA